MLRQCLALPATLNNDTANTNTKHKDMTRTEKIPFVLSDKEKSCPIWEMKRLLATKDLEVAKASLQRDRNKIYP
jgi:hypothetical protein